MNEMTKLHEGNTLSHKPVIDSERSRLHHQLMTVHNDQLYYLGPNGLYSLTYNSKEWKKEADPQFSIESGHSMTSTPHGIVVFGGNVSGKTISDAWIFAVDRWRAFTHDLAPRAYHSCTWIPTMSSVLLSGGSFDHNVYQDFVLLDLKSGKSKTIPLSTPLPFSHHTVTYVSGTQVCLYGGIHANKAENRNMYLIDLSTGEVTIIDSPYLYPARRSHHASLFFGNLFITGGLSQSVVSSDALIYIFEHNVWLNLEFSTSIESSLFVFPMKRGIFFIDETGQNSTVLYYKSNEEPFTGVDDPKYIEFLSSLLDINSKKQKTSPLIMAAQKARRFLSQEKLNMYLEIEKFYHKDILEDTAIAITSHTKEKDILKRLISTLKSIQQTQGSNSVHSEIDIYDLNEYKKRCSELCTSIITLKTESKKSIMRSKEELETLYTEIETLSENINIPKITYSNDILFKASLNDLSQIDEEITKAKSELEKSQQLINEIHYKSDNTLHDAITIYERIDTFELERYKCSQRTQTLTNEYIKLLKQIIDLQSERLHIYDKHNIDKVKKEQKIVLLIDKIEQLINNERDYTNGITNIIANIKNRIMKLTDAIPHANKENISAQIESLCNAFSNLTRIHNVMAVKVDEKDVTLRLPMFDEVNGALNKWTQSVQLNARVDNLENDNKRSGGSWGSLYTQTQNLLDLIEGKAKEN